jgi:hypothetical protein
MSSMVGAAVRSPAPTGGLLEEADCFCLNSLIKLSALLEVQSIV